MIRLGVPSKGRLMEQTFDWFADRGVRLSRAGSDREYAGRVEGVEGVSLVLLSAGEIPRELAAGRIELGVTGTDLVREKLAGWSSDLVEVAPMGFGPCRPDPGRAGLLARLHGSWTISRPSRATSGPNMDSVCASPRNITAWSAPGCPPTRSPTISWSTARARPRARSPT